jgi:hypothetical protein
MKTLDLLGWLVSRAKEYRDDAIASVNRNAHMNDCKGKCGLTQTQVDAILCDFINRCASHQCVDLALYSIDLEKDNEQPGN